MSVVFADVEMEVSPVTEVSVALIEARVLHSVDTGWCSMCEQDDDTDSTTCEDPDHLTATMGDLWDEKLSECDEEFIDSLQAYGIKRPLCIMVDPDNDDAWTFGNGHHRYAVAKHLGFEAVPVIFSFTREWMYESQTASKDWINSFGEFTRS